MISSAALAQPTVGLSGSPHREHFPIQMPWEFHGTNHIPPLLHLDFETYCDLNLRQVGLDVYRRHPSLEINLTAAQRGHSPIWQTESEEEALDTLVVAARDPDLLFVAFNAHFERLILAAKGIDIPPQRWICVMAWAYSMAFNGTLRDVGDQLGLPTDEQKLKSGTRLINKFCAPRKPTKNNPSTRWMPEDAPEDWERFKAYNRQDVVAEAAIANKLMPYFPNEVQRAEFVWDSQVNDLGLPIDTSLVEACCDVYRQELSTLKRRMQDLTGLGNPGSVSQLLPWFATKGLSLPNLQKATVQAALDFQPPGLVHDVLELRSQYAKASPKKWLALERATGPGDRLRGTFQIWGAGRTQRWAARLYQPHNLPWPSVPLQHLPELMLTKDRSALETIHGPVMEPLVSLIRNAVTAPEGYMLGVADLSGIESVTAGYLSGCEAINAVYREGRDLYKQFGSRFFGKPEDEITPAERKFCKPPVLAALYGISPNGLIDYGKGMGVEIIEEDAETAIKVFLEAYPEIPRMWRWLETACKAITRQDPGTLVKEGYGVRIWRDENFLRIQKPDGWCLSYYQPLIETNRWGRVCFSYMGKDQNTGKWRRLHARGALIFENVNQSVARSVLMHGLWLAYQAGLTIIGHVHDEGIIQSLITKAEEELAVLIQCLTTIPSWAPGLLLNAEGKVVKRYAK